jgi:ubiquinone/menaquinone biosynthesis C-methylase UbiE
VACGKGELLIQWARAYELQGTGVDEDEVLIDVAQMRANELEVWSQVQFVASEMLDYPQPFHQYNIVSCLDRSRFAMNISELIATLRIALKDDSGGLLLLGETFWQQTPLPAVCAALGMTSADLPTLGDISAQFTASGVTLLEMHIASTADWDHYYAQQWRACARWLQQHPDDADAPALQAWVQQSRDSYLRYTREFIGYGVFVLQVAGNGTAVVIDEDIEVWQES